MFVGNEGGNPHFGQVQVVPFCADKVSIMHGTTQFHHDSTNYKTSLAELADLYTTLNGAHTPLSSLQTGVHSADRPNLSALFPPHFVRAHSDYTDWAELATAAPWDLTDYDRLQRIPKPALDEVIAAETTFDSMAALIEQAASYHIGDSTDAGSASMDADVGGGK